MKIDIELGKSLTINTGSYSSIKPDVRLTVKDVSVDDFDDAYTSIKSLLDNLFLIEFAASAGMMDEIKKHGYTSISDSIYEDKEEIENEIKKAIKKLESMNLSV